MQTTRLQALTVAITAGLGMTLAFLGLLGAGRAVPVAFATGPDSNFINSDMGPDGNIIFKPGVASNSGSNEYLTIWEGDDSTAPLVNGEAEIFGQHFTILGPDVLTDDIAINSNCSLREAIIAANTDAAVDACPAGSGTDVINLAAGTYTLAITGTGDNASASGDLDITGDLTIIGQGADSTFIDAAGLSDRALHILNATVTISGVTIQGGSGVATGGGISVNNGDLTLENSEVISNSATSGGGVYVASTLTLTGSSVISGNTATDGAGVFVGGVTSTLLIDGGQILGNTASNDGGGVYVDQIAATMTMTSGLVATNAAGTDGGGIYLNFGTATLNGGQIISNTAALGGGVFVANANAVLVQSGFSTIRDNLATSNGGGLNVQNGQVTLTGVQLNANRANNDGGGIYHSGGTLVVTGTVISGNTAVGDQGGGLWTSQSLAVTNTQFISNRATNEGGGLYGASGLTVTSGSFTDNHSIVSSGGGLYAAGTLTLSNTQFTSNTVNSFGGGAYAAGQTRIDGGSFAGNATASHGGGLFVGNTFNLTGTFFLANTASGKGGGLDHDTGGNGRIVNALFARNSAAQGVGLYLNSPGAVEILHTTITSPTLAGGAAIQLQNGTVGLTNTIIASHTIGVEQFIGGFAYEDFNLFFGNITDLTGSISSGSSSISANPVFQDQSNDDYRLGAGSAAVDVGTNAGVLIDFEGDVRPQGLGFDMGYDESALNIPLTLTVNSANDGDDGTCDPVHCSLREAINASNATAGLTSTIAFSISGAGPHTISPATALPTVTVPVIIDGLTEPGTSCAPWPPTLLIQLDGGSTPAGTNGLYIVAGNSTIRGLVINRFPSSAAGPVGGGIYLESDNNVVECNLIGTDPSGTVDLGNGDAGIVVLSGTNNRIGGGSAVSRNLVSGNDGNGIFIIGSSATTNTVQGNRIGTDISGNADLGNAGSGVVIIGAASNNLIGGTTANAANQISGNGDKGVFISGLGTSQNLVQGNIIGLDATNGALGNDGSGVGLVSDASNNTVGGSGPAGNTIAYNGDAGVAVFSGDGNVIQSNTIFSNTLLGIDLGFDGVTPNDGLGDFDAGPNSLQNFPLLDSVTVNGTNVDIAGRLQSSSNASFTLEFFANTVCDPSGNGEGEILIGTDVVTTNVAGFVAFNTSVPPSAGGQPFVTATATDQFGNSSEFSACAPVLQPTDLSISKSINTANVTTRGEVITYTITFTNSGPGVALNVIITDTPPLPTVSFLSIISSGLTITALPSSTFIVSSMGVRSSGIITITAQVTETAVNGTLFTNTVSITASNDITPGNDSAPVAATVNIPIGVNIFESAGSTDVAEGGLTDSYGLSLASQPIAPVTITVSPDTQLNASVSQLVFNPGNWNITQTVVITAVDDFFFESTPHNGLINHSLASSDPLYNALPDLTITAAIADNDVVGLVVIESDGDTKVTEGGATDSYDIVLSSDPFSDVTINITTDSQINTGPTVLTFTTSSWFTPQTVIVFAVDDSISEYFHTGLLTNTASSFSESEYDGLLRTVTAVITDDDIAADLSVTKSDSPDPAVLGQQISYMVQVTNNGPWPATSMQIIDTLPIPPSGLLQGDPISYTIEFNPPRASAAGIGAAAVNCNLVGNVFSCLVDDLSPNATMGINLDVTPNTIGLLTNTVVVAATEFDPAPSNNSAIETTTVNLANIDLGLTKLSSSAAVLVGEPLTYTLNLVNSGPDSAFGVSLVDSLPAGLIIGAITPGQGSCNLVGSTVSCGLGTVNGGGGTAQVTIVVTPSTAFITPTLITNSATVAAFVGTDPITNNNSASAVVTINPATADLGISKNVSAGSIILGERLTYTLNITRAGATVATGVNVTDNLPAGAQLASVTPSQGSCTGSSTVSCNLGTVSGGATVTIVVTPTTVGTITNQAQVGSSFTIDPVPGNNTSNAVNTYVRERAPDLGLTKQAVPDLLIGNSLVYTLTVSNQPGRDEALNVTLIDPLPLAAVFGSATGGACGEAGGTVTCALGNIPAGGSVDVILVVTPTAAITVVNTATVASTPGVDANPLDNTASATTTVEALGAIITKAGGGSLIYTDPQGNPTTISVPPNAVTNSIRLVYRPLLIPTGPLPAGTVSTGHGFTLQAFEHPTGTLLSTYVFSQSMTIAITYSNNDIATVSDENGLLLYYRSGGLWLNAATTCVPSSTLVFSPTNMIQVAVCHLTEFGLFGPSVSGGGDVYLPIILKSSP